MAKPASDQVRDHEAVEDYIATCAAVGKEPERAYSGKVMFRVSPAVYAKAALVAPYGDKPESVGDGGVVSTSGVEVKSCFY